MIKKARGCRHSAGRSGTVFRRRDSVLMNCAVLVSVMLAGFVAPAPAYGAFSWQRKHAEIMETGDLGWAPEPFTFETGDEVRYIDYESGDDANDGLTPRTPWQHHPWDGNAGGRAAEARGIDTYVFKRGVVYRGTLVAVESGEPDKPIRLTSSPEWGEGEAVISGSETVTGWQPGAEHPDIPEPGKVWHTDLDFAPRNVWMVDGDRIARLDLARVPNWTVSDWNDPLSQWWPWEAPRWWEDGSSRNTVTVNGRRMHLGIDSRNLTEDADYYEGATLRTEYAIVMGTPYPTRVEAFDPEQHGIAFEGIWYRDSQIIATNNRYYLEDKPHYLDTSGQFWFDRRGEGGRLYLRLPDDADPNQVVIEAGKRYDLIQDIATARAPDRTDVLGTAQRDELETGGFKNITISALTFRFTNTWWNLDDPLWRNKNVANAAIRSRGSTDNLRVHNCRFEHLSSAVRCVPINDHVRSGLITITDNDVRYLDNEVFAISKGDELEDVRIMRNRLFQTGFRPRRQAHGHAINVNFATTQELAGNMLERINGAGLFVFGGKPSGADQMDDVPFSRVIIHQNRVVDSLLNANDWGGIETWQGGPFYVYNNVSGNPVGRMNWSDSAFGHAYYMDGSFKNYFFNNIAWGRNNDVDEMRDTNCAAFQEIYSFLNTVFHNSAYRFRKFSRRQRPEAGSNLYLANVVQDISQNVFRHSDRDGVDPNVHDAGREGDQFAYERNAYSRNVMHNIHDMIGVFEAEGGDYRSIGEMAAALKERRALASDVGVMAEESPLADPANFDFRPSPQSPADGPGARVFVPWSLYAVTGEWSFRRNNADPAAIIDEHWYMTPLLRERHNYMNAPRFPLTGINIDADSYVESALENWTLAALELNGEDQYLFLGDESAGSTFEPEMLDVAEDDWLTGSVPAGMASGHDVELTFGLDGIGDGRVLSVHVHWMRSDAWGGFLTSAGQQEVSGDGPYSFTFTPETRDGLHRYQLLVFTSPDGAWDNREQLARIDIDRIDPVDAAHWDPQIAEHNFTIETYFRTEPDASGLLMGKMDENGYEININAEGRTSVTLRSGNAVAELTSGKAVNDGQWHHLVVEGDRESDTLTIYIDGNRDASGAGIGERTLTNVGDLYAGGTPEGRNLAVTFDFLRISRGSLMDARTTIEELYAWQFDGPHMRDFTGADRRKHNAAGALAPH